ncbi:hypothetical protein GGS21DRAFT_510144 [Xylaria nigripes]|nr:hypothetical protein GGS21DRAFT_510144 [Xylaria nigripes]
MADGPKPASAKRGLPFKRTIRQKPASGDSITDDDGLALFSQSKTYFPTVVEDQQRRAREKAEQELHETLAREREEAQKKARQEEEKEWKDSKVNVKFEQDSESLRKRHRISLVSDSEGGSSDEDRKFLRRSRKSHRLSTPEPKSHDIEPRSPRSSESRRKTRSLVKAESPVVLLDSSDDEDVTTKRESESFHISPSNSGGRQMKASYIELERDKAKIEDSESDLDMIKEVVVEEENPLQPYIKAAMERMRKEKEARLAREAAAAGSGTNNGATASGINDDRGGTVSVMIVAPTLPESKPLCCTVRTSQALQIAFDTFKERQKVHSKYPHKLISALVFTWRGDRVYNTTKLETLGIRPKDVDGRLHDTVGGFGIPDGYLGKDKVYFEAYTPEEYEENQQKRERERKRQEMGEWWSEEEDADDKYGDSGREKSATGEAETRGKTPQNDEERVRVIFKARNMKERNVTLRKHSTVTQMIKAFRKLAGIGEDQHVEIRWDGEVLDPDTTVEEADIADMDSVEVHIR